MSKSKSTTPTTYLVEHPRFKTSTDKKWLEGRSKFVTGFCSQYQPLECQGHEGTKPTARNGEPRKVCDFYLTCPCTCHQQIDQLYELSGLDREPAEQSPEYTTMMSERHLMTQVMLDSLAVKTSILAPLSSTGDPIDHPGNEGAVNGTGDSVNGTPAGQPVVRFAPTPTGRRARGQLEYDVLTVCQDFANEVFDWDHCTPKNVSEEIGKRYAIEPPSTGAINAVWDRWEKLEFATQDKKPSRFVKFNVNPPSSWVLDKLKSQIKREKRRGFAEQKRGALRPKRGS